MFLKHEFGRIAPGMRADIVAISDDLFTIPPEAIERARVDLTIFAAKVVHER